MKENKINELLNDEIEREIENLKNIEPGSEDHAKAVESLTKLYQLKLDEDTKTEDKKQIVIDIASQVVKCGIELAGIILPLKFYASWMQKGFEFEQTGTFTSSTFKALFQKFKTTK